MTKAYVAIRKNPDNGNETFLVNEISIDPECAELKAKENDKKAPTFAAAYPIIAIAEVEIRIL